MNRRGFLGAILAAGMAPAFVRYGSLMVPKVVTGSDWLVMPEGFGLSSIKREGSYVVYNKELYYVTDSTIHYAKPTGETCVVNLRGQ